MAACEEDIGSVMDCEERDDVWPWVNNVSRRVEVEDEAGVGRGDPSEEGVGLGVPSGVGSGTVADSVAQRRRSERIAYEAPFVVFCRRRRLASQARCAGFEHVMKVWEEGSLHPSTAHTSV